jgi:hypothetical protein
MESNINFFEHVLSNDDCQTLINYLLNDTLKAVSLDYINLKRTRALEHDIVIDLSKKLNINFDRAFVMQYSAGIGSVLHNDNYSIEESREVFNAWKYSGVVFLNQEFDGGELVYPNQGITIKPVTGNMVIAPADESAPHSVNPPSADRYVLVLRII